MLLIAEGLLGSALGLLGLLYALHCAPEGDENREGFHYKRGKSIGVGAHSHLLQRASNRARSLARTAATFSDKFWTLEPNNVVRSGKALPFGQNAFNALIAAISRGNTEMETRHLAGHRFKLRRLK